MRFKIGFELIGRVFVLLCIGFLLVFNPCFAQCPIASNCTPGSAPTSNYIFGLGIYNVSVGTGTTGFINATSGGSADGYQDYSCTKKASVFEGVPTSISITTNPNVNENVKVWVDLNNNGVFEPSAELVFSSIYAKQHVGAFTIPTSATVVKNTLLRMRISAENFASPIPGPCSTPQYSQVEDYGIMVLPNTQKPVVDFDVPNPTVCSPTVQFQNLTQNGTTYFWDFGNNTTSTQANPAHTYAAYGTYTIKLKACNANGCDSLTKTNYIIYQNTAPVAASCTPIATNYCCGYGITKVTFASMVNSSANGSAGYEDFTCTKSVTVSEGETYPIALETSPTLIQDTWVYIDFNNNGAFEASELVLTKLNLKNPTGFITIPNGKLKNTPLRMRIISDEQGSSAGPCTNLSRGQAEDYTVIITPSKLNFTSNFSSICNSNVQFTTLNSPAATSWTWDFGDGTTSNLQNPQHNYTNNGIYLVKLKVCSPAGCDSVFKRNYIAINKPCLTYCLPSVNTNFSAVSITRVSLKDIDNITTQEPTGYGNYTKLATSLTQGGFSKLSLNVVNSVNGGNRAFAWIDFNRDGDFQDAGEEVMYGKGTNISKIITVPATAIPGMTRMRITAFPDSILVNSCYNNLKGGEIEDYSIEIKAFSEKPNPYFSSKVNACNGLSVQFSDSSSNLPTTRFWNFGDPASGAANTDNLQNPVHTFSSAGTYTVRLKTCNSFGCDSLQQVITVQANTVQEPLNTCAPPQIRPAKHFFGIEKVAINTINNVTSGEADGYKNYACSQRTTLALLNTYNLTVQTAIQPHNQPSHNLFNENVKVWIDFNNNGSFQESNELILNSTSHTIHSISFIPPNNAVINQPLRMRVANIFKTGWRPSSIQHCVLPDSGEVEDYTVTIVPFNNIPGSAFTQDSKIACGNAIQFRDTSSFIPTSWLWSFGDTASGVANTSTLKNPSHTFSGPGTYTITLTTCNSNGCNTIVKNNYVTAQANNLMLASACKPQTLSSCCGNGISGFSYGYSPGNLLTHSGGLARNGYQDLTCTVKADINTNLINYILVNTFNPTDHTAVWIDYNNNGMFESTEKVFAMQGPNLTLRNIVVPANVVKGVYLRLRVISQASTHPILDACSNPVNGVALDYGVRFITPPVSDFSYMNNCTGTLTFADSSKYLPTTWLWNFNDPTTGTNNTSTLQNPSHAFSGPGNYLVSLRACNAFGCNTKQGKVVVGINPNINLIPACRPTLYGSIIEKVMLGNINHTTTTTSIDRGYWDYSCVANTTLTLGNTYALTVDMMGANLMNAQIWIDFDNNGVFDPVESVMHSLNAGSHTGNITIPATAVKNSYIRMRVKADDPTMLTPGPCTNSIPQNMRSQVKDYAVMIVDPVGMNEVNLANSINVFPNPNNGIFTLELPAATNGNYQLEVLDILGKTVAKKELKVQGSTPVNVDLSYLPRGLYVLNIKSSSTVLLKKIIIQ